jgi:RNA polymerase sigma-70 factor (ECF subfamily)
VNDFDRFFESQKRSLVGQAFVLTGNIEEAHDIVQEVFLRVWARWSRVATLDNPPAWARSVLRNLAIGRWRRLQGRAESPLFESDLVSPAPDVGHLDVARALHLLPEQQRTALILHDVVGLSVVETAAEMGVPEGSVRGWLSRGRRSLADSLGLGLTAAPVNDGRKTP